MPYTNHPSGHVHSRDGKVIRISDIDAQRWSEAEVKHLGPSARSTDQRWLEAEAERFGPWVHVTDQITGDDFDVRSAPCGSLCRCAADIRESST